MTGKSLVVILHAFEQKPAAMRWVAEAAKRDIAPADICIPQLPLFKLSTADPLDIVRSILDLIDEKWRSETYARIVLVGHSFGALLARKVYVAACGNEGAAPLEAQLQPACPTPRIWAHRVERIVLLAGMNNGWSIDYHMPFKRMLGLNLGVFGGWLFHLFRRKWPVIFSARRGSPFVTQLRIQWLVMRRAASAQGVEGAMVIQLLGTVDDMVSPRDNIDLVTGQDFYFLDVPKSGHRSVIQMDESAEGIKRRAVFADALRWSRDDLKTNSVPLTDVNPVTQDDGVHEVVFVIHGIRDEGFWTEKIARSVVQEGRLRGRKFARETSTYGYFGMIPFLLSFERRRKMEWLMNRYAEAIARYPKAEAFHYVGHSNGTYLLAKALEQYPCCFFNRVVFAGSVVRTTYDWKRLMTSRSPQVREVLNYAATGDWVVAYFPGLFESLGLQDLGAAGHKGFTPDEDSGNPQVKNIEYVVGSHGAALQEDNWRAIARFIVNGRDPSTPLAGVHVEPEPEPVVSFFGRYPLFVWFGLALLVSIVPTVLYWAMAYRNFPQWSGTALLIGYAALIIFVGRRV